MNCQRAILGDNQFLGVNHASDAVAGRLDDRFKKSDAILEVLGWAYEAGIRDFMFTVHDRYEGVFAEVLRSRLFPGLKYIPCLPYAHRYANLLAELGPSGAFKTIAMPAGVARVARAMIETGCGHVSRLASLLVELELQMTKGLMVEGVFLQNVFFDLLLGLDQRPVIESFHRYVTDELHATPGYITMNHPAAQDFLCNDIGIRNPWLCANLNVAGVRMHPSPERVRNSLSNGRSINIAMSVFASGAVRGMSWQAALTAVPTLRSVVYGSSRKEHIIENARRIGETLGPITAAETVYASQSSVI